MVIFTQSLNTHLPIYSSIGGDSTNQPTTKKEISSVADKSRLRGIYSKTGVC